jgi:hypothetical protein
MIKHFSFVVVIGLMSLAANVANAQGRYATHWLQNEQIRKELEIIDEQVEKIGKVQTEWNTAVRELYADIGKLPREEQAEQYRLAQEKMQKFYMDAEAKLKDILLPQQIDRLEQISNQMQMRGGAGYGLRGELAEKIGLTAEQQKLLQDKAGEKNKQLTQKYAELRSQMEEELLSEVLTPQQRDQLKQLIGEPFEFQAWQPMAAQGAVAPKSK